MAKHYFEQIDGSVKPTELGFYITNFGSLEWNGETFLMNGGRRFPTIVEWWLIPYTPRKNN